MARRGNIAPAFEQAILPWFESGSMARILAISSLVARGTVGLSIVVPALQAMGHEVIGLPTVLLSNHPGHAHVSGMRVDPRELTGMLDALDLNGWLRGMDGVLTGYLPSPGHVAFARETVMRTRAANPACVYLCDPVLGDDPKGLYIDEDAARAIRGQLIQYAHVLTPNRFEAGYLADAAGGYAVGPGPIHVTTSVPSDRPRELLNEMNVLGRKSVARVQFRPAAPHGTGDLFAALYLARYIRLRDAIDALGFATAGVDATLAVSAGLDWLSLSALMPHPPNWVNWPVTG